MNERNNAMQSSSNTVHSAPPSNPKDGSFGSQDVIAVTVTYGDRWHLLQKALLAARAEGVSKCIVVSNGASDDVSLLVKEDHGDWAEVVVLPTNLGSATGFKSGIERALIQGQDYIILLDDDNILSKGALSALIAGTVENRKGENPFAIFALRGGHGAELAKLAFHSQETHLSGSCWDFHILDVPSKLRRRIFKNGGPSVCMPASIAVRSGPYGGLLFHKSLIQQIGYPNESFVLYQDDTDFTHRIPRAGGTLMVATGSHVDDAEPSWDSNSTNMSSFSIFLNGESDFRAFYTFRNRAYWDLHSRRTRSPIYIFNALLYLLILSIMAARGFKYKRMRLLCAAFWDGCRGRLGINPLYPLPTSGRRPIENANQASNGLVK